jgi:hypothetical protein
MKYQQQQKQTGAWVDKKSLQSGTACKIVSETQSQPSSFKDKNGNTQNQDVCKVRFNGQQEAVNVNLNGATIGAMIDAFGDESINWQNKPLTVETEKMRVGGKAVVALYLIPEGYERVDDENGYAVIVKKGLNKKDIPVINEGNYG